MAMAELEGWGSAKGAGEQETVNWLAHWRSSGTFLNCANGCLRSYPSAFMVSRFSRIFGATRLGMQLTGLCELAQD